MKQTNNKNVGLPIAGIFFAVLWPSASVATKVALQSLQPFVIAVTRFFIAGIAMLLVAHIFLRKQLPRQHQWRQLAIYGFLNITVYLGLYVLAMQQVSAELGSMATATNPVFISIISALWYKEKLKPTIVVSLLLCFAGVLVAACPLLMDSYASAQGLLLLIISMLCYSVGAIYFSKSQWDDLHILTINGWQTIFGGIFLLPFAIFLYDGAKNDFNGQAVACVLWLAVAVSVGAVQLWLLLLKDNPVKASFWLFLCPVTGFFLAAVIMKEPLSWFTIWGVLLVIAGLYLVQKKIKPNHF